MLSAPACVRCSASWATVVEAKAEDWSLDPFTLTEKDGYYYGRGTSDDKMGVVAVTTALLQLRSQGFRPTRDIIVFFTGDEETSGHGAQLGATQWKSLLDVEYGLVQLDLRAFAAVGFV